MTLNEIIAASLGRLGRGTDEQTIDFYRHTFTDYANRAIKKIALEFKQHRKEAVELDEDGMFDVKSLARGCYAISEVRAAGKSVDFWQEPLGSGFFMCDTKEPTVDVFYRFVPARVSASADVPELPEYMHDLIPLYVVACERCGGDPDTQGTASADFQLFNEGLRELLRETRGEPRSYKLLNY